MIKDFDGWHKQKKFVQLEEQRLYSVREIWWCQFGVNIGSEQDGKGEKYLRPCVILRAFGADSCLVVPLTTSTKVHFLRVPLGDVSGRQSSANISQLRVIDTRRLIEKISFLENGIFARLKKHVRDLF